MGLEPFLLERAFDDCLDRLRDIARPFGQALLLGCPSPDWPARLRTIAEQVEVIDPGPLFAAQAGGFTAEEDRYDFSEQRYDLCVAIGTLDTVNDLPIALQLLRRSLRTDAPIIGAIAGGNSLPSLRASLIEAGRAEGRVVARTHPRIEAPMLAQLLSAAGFAMPVVDIDRVKLRYADLGALVRDLRAMASTSILCERAPPLSNAALRRANDAFREMGGGGKTEEVVEILHFLGWSQLVRQSGD